MSLPGKSVSTADGLHPVSRVPSHFREEEGVEALEGLARSEAGTTPLERTTRRASAGDVTEEERMPRHNRGAAAPARRGGGDGVFRRRLQREIAEERARLDGGDAADEQQ